MWRNIRKLTDAQMSSFEERFSFRICSPLREFLIEHNGGFPSPGLFPTLVRERKVVQFLDFSDNSSKKGAWAINQRVRKVIGSKRLVIGIDSLDNFICIEREYNQQEIVLWNHVTDSFEECLWSIPRFVQSIGNHDSSVYPALIDLISHK